MQDKPAIRDLSAENGRQPELAALMALFALAVLSVIFYKERTLFTDAANIIFNRVNVGILESSQRRYGAYITEAVPLVLAKIHTPLKAILIAYSLSFNLFYLAVGTLLFLRYRAYNLVILMACYYTVFVSAGYYWTNNEIHQAVAYLFLCLGITQYNFINGKSRILLFIQFTVFSALAIGTHPLLGIAFIFIWVFFLLDKHILIFSKWDSIIMSAILFAIFIGKLALSSSQGYDAMRMSSVLKTGSWNPISIFCSGAMRMFAKESIKNYWWSIVLLIAGALAMARRCKWLSLLWVLLSFIGVLALISLTFGSFPYLYYPEGEWQILGIIVAAPFVYYVLPRLKVQWATALLSAVFATRLVYIIIAGTAFTHRVAYIEEMLSAMRKQALTKVVLNARDGCPEGVLLKDWGLATESTLLSALDGEYPQRTICAIWPQTPDLQPAGNKEMVWNFDKRPVSLLNPIYFAIDTTKPYVRMDYETLTGQPCNH